MSSLFWDLGSTGGCTEAEKIRELTLKLSRSRVLIAGDIDFGMMEGIDIDLLVAKVKEREDGKAGMQILDKTALEGIMEGLRAEKSPMPIEVVRPSGFRPFASEVEPSYEIGRRDTEKTGGTVADFVSHFNDRLERLRHILETHSMGTGGAVASLEVASKLTSGREIVVTGIVLQKITTKNGNIMAVLEDETGSAKVMFMKGSSQQAASLFAKASTLVNDEVIAVKGKISGPFIMAGEIIWPDIPIREQKKTEEDIAIAFISDIHVGSKFFMEKNFLHMIKWLNGANGGGHNGLAGKIKYLVVGGDAVDGVGVYPQQEKSLSIPDVYSQYKVLLNLMDSVPDYIEVFIIPGNHDAVQRAEPQPAFDDEITGDFKRDNIHFLPNPITLKLHKIDVLSYHGTSLDSVISAIPNMSYATPEKAMVEVLKRRHLSPIYGGNVIMPNRYDKLVIDKAPDILHMGHIHKNGIDAYHGTTIINSGTWQARTDFQVRQGHIPTPCIMPVMETKRRIVSSIDFNTG